MLDTFLDTYYENHNYTEDDAEEYVRWFSVTRFDYNGA